MAELAFPAAALVGTFFVLIPALTLASRAMLARARRNTHSWGAFGSESTFAWLVAPSLLPVAWLGSAALHQIEPGRGPSCAISHGTAAACIDAALLLLVVGAGVSAAAGARAWHERPRLRLRALTRDDDKTARVRAIAQATPALRDLRVVVAKHISEPVFTIGWLRQRVVLDACFVRDADDDMLRAALLHERAHIDDHDALRAFIVRFSLALNPAARWLSADFERWRHAREAQCDSHAVSRGGEPLALAEGLVRAARFTCGGHAEAPRYVAALCGHDATALKLRVALLLDGPPRPVRTAGHAILCTVLIASVLAPHGPGPGALDLFHVAVERLIPHTH